MTMTKDNSPQQLTPPSTTTAPTLPFNDSTSIPSLLNDSAENFWAVLERLNNERAVYFVPAVIWVLLLMVTGVVGNILVIYVYRRRFKRTSSNYFILTMAVFDLVACLIGSPTEIYDLLRPFTFYSNFGCKLLRATENFTIYGSVVVLVEIAFDRYFKICRPLMMVSLFKIKVLCGLAVASAFLMAIPSPILFGINRTDTPVPGVRGYDCSISETYRGSDFQLAYFLCLAVVFLITLAILTALYVRIWLELRQRRRMLIGDQLGGQGSKGGGDRCTGGGGGNGGGNGGGGGGAVSVPMKKFRLRYLPSMSEDEVMAMTAGTALNSRNNSTTQLTALTTTFNPATTTTTTTPTDTSSPSNRVSPPTSSLNTPTPTKKSRFNSLAQFYASNMQVSRTTVVLFAVTVAFVLSFFPALAVMVVRTLVKDFDKTQSMASLAVTKIFIKFSFINNAINPIIYSFLNVNFRRQAQTAVQKMFCCCWRRRSRGRGRGLGQGGGGWGCLLLPMRQPPHKSGSDRNTKKEFVHV